VDAARPGARGGLGALGGLVFAGDRQETVVEPEVEFLPLDAREVGDDDVAVVVGLDVEICVRLGGPVGALPVAVVEHRAVHQVEHAVHLFEGRSSN